MKVTYNWLKDFVDIKISPQDLADKLTMAGLEVTSQEEREGDFVFEIEVTSNRPDCLSVLGIAGEIAAVTNSKLKSSCVMRHASCVKSAQRTAHSAQPLTIEIQDKKDCPLYTAKIIKDVKVGPSPEWLKKRLELVGCRSVNNIVDIANYVLFELGEPLHAFDLDRLNQDAILVRRAKINEKLATIDGEQKILNPDILVIADKTMPVAIAGIMGGKDTEVNNGTKNILLEAAIFNPIIVRSARQSLGIQSESAYRFERGIDLEVVEKASIRATELIEEIALGKCVLAKSLGAAKVKKKTVNLELSIIDKILGINIAALKIRNILSSLGFGVKTKTKNNFRVLIPPRRPDINLEIDLIEEVARIFGYERIPKSLPAIRPQATLEQTRDLSRPSLKSNIALDEERGLLPFIKNILVGLSLNEVVTYSLIDKNLLASFNAQPTSNVIEILNPLSKEQEILRPSLIPSLCVCIAYNLNQKQETVNIFEIAKIFRNSKDSLQEELYLGIAISAESLKLAQGQVKDTASLLHLKGIAQTLFSRLGMKDYSLELEKAPLTVGIYARKEQVGQMLELPKGSLEKLGIKNKDVFALELSLDKALSCAQLKKRFLALPKYPAIVRDISFILKDDIQAKEVLDTLKEKGQPLLEDINIVDYYKGKQIPPDYKGLTISCVYRSKQRTLTETEITPLHSLLCAVLTEKFGVKIR